MKKLTHRYIFKINKYKNEEIDTKVNEEIDT